MTGSLAIFDLDDTLWSRRDALISWAGSIAELEGTSSRNPVEIVLQADGCGETDRTEFLNRVHHELQLNLTRSAFERWYQDTYPKCFRPFPGVGDALHRLRVSGWKLAVVSNGNGIRQREKLRASGLTPFFHTVVSADEAGTSKPSAGIFLRVAERLDCPLKGWVLGDSPEEDMAGGQRVGLRAAWVNPTGVAWDFPSAPPNLVAATVVELIHSISEL